MKFSRKLAVSAWLAFMTAAAQPCSGRAAPIAGLSLGVASVQAVERPANAIDPDTIHYIHYRRHGHHHAWGYFHGPYYGYWYPSPLYLSPSYHPIYYFHPFYW